MDRSLAKLAAALLLGTSLTACSTFGDSSPETAAAKPPVKGTTSPRSMAADLDIQIHTAQAARASGDYAGATKILAQLMLVTPDDPRVVGEYGKTLVQQGRSKEALDFLKRAVQLQSGDWSIYSAMGVAYDQQADYVSARPAYSQALALKPRDPGVINNYALSRMQANDPSGARQLMAQLSPAETADPKIAQTVALIASVTPAQAPVVAQPVKTTAMASNKAVPVAVHALPNLGPNVVMQSVPKDPKAGTVHEATGAPHQLAKDAPPPSDKEPVKTLVKPAPHKTAVAAATTDAKKEPAASANKTPALRMTADAATP